MSKKAEELANKRWPIHPFTILPKEGAHGEILNFDEWLDDYRISIQSFSANKGYEQGYEQAEKDLIPLINRLCEAIIMDWDSKDELAKKTLLEITVLNE